MASYLRLEFNYGWLPTVHSNLLNEQVWSNHRRTSPTPLRILLIPLGRGIYAFGLHAPS